MNNKQIPKVKLFMGAMVSRLKENSDFFVGIDITFKSGTREFVMEITREDEAYSCFFLGVKTEITIEDISDIITDKLIDYESAVIVYRDRMSELIISCDDKNVSSKQRDAKNDVPKTATVGGREYIIKENEASELLKAIGVMAENGKIKNDMVRKYNQIDRFIELISDIEPRDGMNIMDCGCGKSYLSFVLNYYYTEVKKKKCHVYGIDYNKGVIEASKKMADALGYRNMNFIAADLRELDLNLKADVVISLHACDIATDYAIYSGLKHKSRAIICVPCCHKELMGQIKNESIGEILKHGVYKNRFCDMLTDTMRSLLLEAMGYKVSVIEYVSPLDTPKNVMLKAVKTGGYNQEAMDEFYRLKDMFKVRPTLEALISML